MRNRPYGRSSWRRGHDLTSSERDNIIMKWIKVDAPKRKRDYRFKYVRLLEIPPSSSFDFQKGAMRPPLPIRFGDIAQIYMRRKPEELDRLPLKIAESFSPKILELKWDCPHCGATHSFYVPEHWIEEGKIEFVEKGK